MNSLQSTMSPQQLIYTHYTLLHMQLNRYEFYITHFCPIELTVYSTYTPELIHIQMKKKLQLIYHAITTCASKQYALLMQHRPSTSSAYKTAMSVYTPHMNSLQ